jgi:hypothetical protein
MHGGAVKRLQEMLDGIDRRYDTGSNDGIYGPASERAVKMFQADNHLATDGIVGPVTWAAIKLSVDSLCDGRTDVSNGIIDITKLHGRPRNYGYERPLASIRGIMVHQTGCDMPRKPEGWGRVNGHYGVTLEALPIRINPMTSMIHHGNKPSPVTVGIEIEGNHEGILGDASTLWRGGGGPHYVSEPMVNAFRVIVQDIICRGVGLDYVRAHRQSKAARRGDPGSEIWKRCVMPIMDEFGLDDGGPDWKTRNGRVIPREWNSEYYGRY